MSAPSKRHAGDSSGVFQPKRSNKNVENERLEAFLTWSDTRNFRLNKKVKVGREGSCAQYGMVAVDDIMEGEMLFQIPRDMLLHPGTTEIKSLIEENRSTIESKSGWVPLLVSLMFEYNSPTSLWRPYFDLVPEFSELELPMFWSSSETENLLAGTNVPEAVCEDLRNIETEFTEIVLPFVQKHPDKFRPICKDLEFYKKMVAFVMAYSFTEPIKQTHTAHDKENQALDDSDDEEDEKMVTSPPMMVPMADILNHIAKNNAHLTFEKEVLKMIATKEIKKGEEVFNTYGELSNCDLLHMYGFAEPYPNNHFDEAIIYGQMMMETARELECNSEEVFSQKKILLQQMGLLDTQFIAGVDGILTEEEMIQTLKIWTMSDDALRIFKENEGWEDDDNQEESLLYENGIGNLPKDQQTLLSRCAAESLRRYKSTLEEDEAAIQNAILTSRPRYSLYVKIGQKQILKKIIDCCR